MSIDHPDSSPRCARGSRRRRNPARARARVHPRVTTGELDKVAAAVFAGHGARSGPRLDYDFPGTVCISMDEECVHGSPGPRRLREGQLVKLDVTAELNGFYADACRTVPIGKVRGRDQRLAAAAQSALRRGLRPRPRAPTSAPSARRSRPRWSGEVQRVRAAHGHGVGRRIHEEPDVPMSPGRSHAHERAREQLSRSSPPAAAMCTSTITARPSARRRLAVGARRDTTSSPNTRPCW